MARNIDDYQTLLIGFPETLADEMDAICEDNVIGRTEYIQLAIRQLMDYMDAYGTMPLLLRTSARIKQRRRDLQEAIAMAALKAKEEKKAARLLAKKKLAFKKLAAEIRAAEARKRR